MNTEEATKVSLEKREEIHEGRKEKIWNYIYKNPGETAYSISKNLIIPRTSVIRILDELEDELQIKYRENIENGREKKEVHVRTIDDFTHTYFNVQNLDVKLTKRLINNSQQKGLDVTIRMEDGSEEILKHDETIEQFKKRLTF